MMEVPPAEIAPASVNPVNRDCRFSSSYMVPLHHRLDAHIFWRDNPHRKSIVARQDILSPFEALQLMRYEMREKLDQEILGTFVLFLGQT